MVPVVGVHQVATLWWERVMDGSEGRAMTDDAGTASSLTGGDPTIGSQLQDGMALAQLNDESAQLAAAAKQDGPPENGMGWANPRAVMLDTEKAQAAAAAATGAGFEFTPEQINTQLAHCKQQLNDLQNDLQDAEQAEAAVHPPAPDDASVAQANAVRNMLSETVASIKADINYLSQWQETLTQAQARYIQTEQLTTDEWNRLANGVQS